MKTIANPRLTDVLGSDFNQDDVDFAIPRVQEDIPLYIDPFLLWNSAKTEYRALHERIINFFRILSYQVRTGDIREAADLLAGCEELPALGLGYSVGTRKGTNIGPKLISEIIRVHRDVPQLSSADIRHIEELQLVVSGLAEDRISDTASSVIKDYFIEYTANQARLLNIPTRSARLGNIYDAARQIWVPAAPTDLPFNPTDNSPILFAPLDLLRHLPWINYEDYYRSSYGPKVGAADSRRHKVAKAAVLAFNATAYQEVEQYVDYKEKTEKDCKPDPLFKPFTAPTLAAKFSTIRSLPTGSADGADRKYEDVITDLLSSILYPTLEFAKSSVRTVSGAHIRDLIFYNDGKNEFWNDIRNRYEARQPVFELKNVRALETEHINQLYRYLDDEFGRFGVLVTRNPVPHAIKRNIVDIHSSKRVAIITLDDRDIELMMAMLDSGRDPSDVLKKKFIEFTRMLPK